ncbi:hypothetical protein Lal_00034996 [Lupinus albus]|uniref:Uncharacterized protein n=1 Tax=Lupinus albus TaxID=3870 RepID=A0A6A4QRS5_LUPAL|nr:hypothetical protein Lalb_Chr03g0035761 [Lupinus albus]KAF1897293.1 hypothetical protein Lal_00034996 [Lupinus albus]
MATQSYLLNSLYLTGLQPSIFKPKNFGFSESSKHPTKQKANSSTSGAVQCCSCHTEILYAATTHNSLDSNVALNTLKLCIPGTLCPSTDFFSGLVLADLDPATAKLAIGFLGPFLSAFGFLFILRIVMSWYPKLPVGKFPYVIAYAPTEPLLSPTRKVIPPLAGVDVSPVVWFGLISFLNEILVGPQGLLVLLSKQIN